MKEHYNYWMYEAECNHFVEVHNGFLTPMSNVHTYHQIKFRFCHLCGENLEGLKKTMEAKEVRE